MTCSFKFSADITASAALPDNGFAGGCGSFSIENADGFPLVGDTDGRDEAPSVIATEGGLGLFDRLTNRYPNLIEIMLDPTRGWEVLWVINRCFTGDLGLAGIGNVYQ